MIEHQAHTVNSRERMHDNHIFLRPGKDGVIDPVSVLDLEPLHLTGEPFLLNSSHVKDISISENLIQRLANGDRNACLASSQNDAGGHGESGRSDEVQAN